MFRLTAPLRALLLAAALPLLCVPSAATGGELRLDLRSRDETEPGSGRYHTRTRPATWEAAKTAIVVCDMWDRHWCAGATRRVAEMAPRMNAALRKARAAGALVIHCPSSCMDSYRDTPQRTLAQQAPRVEPRRPLQAWCHLDREREGPLPIDDADGGCDCHPQCKQRKAWTRQIDAIEIAPGDAITDNAEAYYLMRQRGIENVLVMGVHTNMCVLGRPFSIRQLVYQGLNVALVRDLTDTMYNPRSRPFVSHFTGTDLVVAHIERHWCPTITSADLAGGEEFRFAADKRSHLAIVIAEQEYDTKSTLPDFAARQLGHDFRTSFVFASATDRNDLPGIDVLAEADLALLSIRRRTPPQAQLDVIRKFLADGKPLVGIRTTSHAFALRGAEPPAGHADWPRFDREILGGNYGLHYGSKGKEGAETVIRADADAAAHPILQGVRRDEFTTSASLYRHRPLVESATPLAWGRFGENPREPVAWTNTTPHGGRVFYTMLGHVDDFKAEPFPRLLRNGIYWAAGKPSPAEKETPPREAPAVNEGGDWRPLPVPGTWEDRDQRLARYDGFAWYRCRVDLPAAWRKAELSLFVGQVDNVHAAYVNGTRVGGAGTFPPLYANGLAESRRYRIPNDLLQGDAPLTIAVRVYDHDGRGGFKGAAPALFNERQAIDLAGLWQFRTGDEPAWARSSADESLPRFAKVQRAAEIAPRVVSNPVERGGLGPAEAAASFDVADDLVWEQVLAEPDVRQPVFLNFDERGRMWVVQYLQYPHPAGLKMVSRDNYWRAVYDRVPPPPPEHFPGRDKITIHEDSDGDGRFDRHKTFLDGLNIATAVERGRGGVWILNPPYLLFYPDADRDDVPDGDPVVHLAGFGLEDTHSVANSLRWGPDGWLYGAQGSTVTGHMRRPGLDEQPLVHTMGQLIWRYHPESRRFEVFAEGGGNAFGLEFDAAGRIFSGHNGGDTRGFHYVQGAYLRKGFGKHGPLSNPYAFGYFPPMAHHKVPRFTHNFVICESGGLPEKYRGHLLGVEPLQGQLVLSQIAPDGATFRTRDVTRPVTSDDAWFRPVDIKGGPDGAIYVADWYDGQVNHYRNHEGRIDPTNGRIYRLAGRDAERTAPFDLATATTDELIELLKHENKWFRQTAQRLLADRRDADAHAPLRSLARQETGQLALEAVWALHGSGGLDDATALALLDHGAPQVRLWTVRLLGDARQVAPSLAARLARLAAEEPDLEVRGQLASTARRLPPSDGLPIVRGLVAHDADAGDARQPLLVWWALETHCRTDPDAVLALFDDAPFWSLPLVAEQLAARLMRRFAAAGSRLDLARCARLLELAATPAATGRLLEGFEEAYAGRPLPPLPARLARAIARAGGGSLALRLRSGDGAAVDEALERIADDKAPLAERLQLVEVAGQIGTPGGVDPLLKLAENGPEAKLRRAALTALAGYDDPAIGARLLKIRDKLPLELQGTALAVVAGRAAWAGSLLDAVERSRITATEVPPSAVTALGLLSDAGLVARARRLLPAPPGEDAAALEARVAELVELLEGGHGSPYAGKQLFRRQCGKCHTLFGDGGAIGPDLTTFQRDDLPNMLLAIVHPSAQVREGYEQFIAVTDDGRVTSGFVVDEDPRVVLLRTAEGQTVPLQRAKLEAIRPAGRSLMPAGLLDPLEPQQIRDLFAYLRSTQPLND